MAEYQLRPTLTKKQWLAIVAAVLVAFLTPMILNLVVEESDRMDSTVEVDILGEDQIVLRDENDEPLVCKEVALGGDMRTYECGATTVYTGVTLESEDQAQTLRRMMRSITYSSSALDVPVAEVGFGVRIANYTDYHMIGVSLATELDGTPVTAYVIIEDSDFDALMAYSYYAIKAFRADDSGDDIPLAPLLPEDFENSMPFERPEPRGSANEGGYDAARSTNTESIQALGQEGNVITAQQGANNE